MQRGHEYARITAEGESKFKSISHLDRIRYAKFLLYEDALLELEAAERAGKVSNAVWEKAADAQKVWHTAAKECQNAIDENPIPNFLVKALLAMMFLRAMLRREAWTRGHGLCRPLKINRDFSVENHKDRG
eukprot:TRINITY_DN4698_c0_g1_i2.p4 TRINITY_DN4698_c0_g1~~TRINITY_DN4698_c0_g1_i2.p4  ORF type:complete len:131 (+),score=23.95 TRINITY_DN4698_c0_g1_i2:915-1307(+)